MTATTAVSRFVIDGLTVVHPGDIGIPVTQDLIASLQGTDLLFVPVGGRFTLDPSEALDFVAKLNPRIAIPIHFKTPAVLLPLRPVEDFLELCGRVRRFNAGEVRLDPETLPLSTEIWHLPPLL
jgi:L-ascorbate metabolism protein UlaG (beta-lactamase superfamily)